MKKTFSKIIAAITFCFVILLYGCSTDTTEVAESSSQSESAQQSTEINSSSQTSEQVNDLVSSFQPPADVIEIDLSKDDPSNDDITFEYDDEGRISKCYYTVNGIDVYQGYIYKDNTVEIFSYNGSIVIGDASFEYTSDANAGFSEYSGYYFKNVKIG